MSKQTQVSSKVNSVVSSLDRIIGLPVRAKKDLGNLLEELNKGKISNPDFYKKIVEMDNVLFNAGTTRSDRRASKAASFVKTLIQ